MAEPKQIEKVPATETIPMTVSVAEIFEQNRQRWPGGDSAIAAEEEKKP